jgi:RimJ/RimL family protein N-acetyltransferase
MTEANRLCLPCIRKASVLRGKSLVFRNATELDAEFILSLRSDSVKSRYLSATSADIEAQKAWLQRYAGADDQAYFMIQSADRLVGTVRLYDAQGGSFCWGSWILASDAPGAAAIESALMVYAYAVDHLGFQSAHFDVRKGNESVWKFHERFGAVRIDETQEDFLYKIPLAAIQQARSRYAKYLPAGVIVV